jgi:2-oxoglutarate dehydrogenase E2 component (dihydrolipoamide succinyltransferase)
MAQYELILPKMGESVAEATIIKWEKNPGDDIDVDDIVLEVATDKVDSEVPSPVKGKMVKHLFNDGEIAQVGDVIAIIETEKAESLSDMEPEDMLIPEEKSEDEPVNIPFVPEESTINQEEELVKDSLKFYSPLVKSIAQEEGIDFRELDNISGTGIDGRVTKSDLLDYIQSKSKTLSEPVKGEKKETIHHSFEESVAAAQSSYTSPVSGGIAVSGGDEIIEMDRMRKMIADHMIHSKQISAHVSSFIETDVTNLVQWRNKVKSAFEKREQEKITFTPIFVEAVAKAIKDMPMINISLNGTQIIKKKDINIGMATALPNGNLIVPVIKNADQLNLVGLTKSVNDLAARARINKLKPDEIQGGTFTITNIGGFGNIMGTPIINQPQVAILAIGVIKKKPAVIETEHGDMIGIRHLMYMSMSYDHRIVDGALGGMFLKRVSDYLEQWDINREI